MNPKNPQIRVAYRRVPEKYFSVQETAWLLSVSRDWVWDRVRCGQFGEVVELDGRDVRIPASGINSYLASHPYHPPGVNGIAARTIGELRREVAQELSQTETSPPSDS